MAKWLILGSEGTIGSHLVQQLGFQNEDVEAHDIKTTNYDITNKAQMDYLHDNYRPDYTVLLAAMVGRVNCEDNPHKTLHTNVNAVQNVVHACVRYKSKLVYISTSEAYGSDFLLSEKFPVKEEGQMTRTPTFRGIYGLTKNMAEKIVHYYELKYALDCVIIRPFMIYSGAETGLQNRVAVVKIMDLITEGLEVTVHSDTSRSWCYVSDCVDGIILAAKKGQGLYNIGNNQEYVTSHELVQRIGKICGVKKVDVRIEEPGDLLYPYKYFSTRVAELDLGFKPVVDLDTGLRMAYEKRY